MESTNSAPWISVSTKGRAISVEHPCIIKNVEKGIEMLGGSPGISQALEDPSKPLSLTFRTQDPAARPILAHSRQTDNILLRISVPARTNRKRKRGSNDPFIEYQGDNSPKRDAAYLLRSMADNTNSYHVDAVTAIQNMHVWRSMPDFVYSTSQIKALQDVKDRLLTSNYPSIRDFHLPRTYGLENTESIPPPMWSSQSVPQTYTYRENPSVRITKDPSTGKRIVQNTQAAPKIYSYQVQWDTLEYPKVPMPDTPPLEQQTSVFQRTVGVLGPLFDERPIWTRRALLNQLDPAHTSFNLVRFCIAYVAFAIRSGPWRDTYCRLGVDPRTDPECRFYQSIMLQLVPKIPVTRAPGENRNKTTEATAPDEDVNTPPNTNVPDAQNDSNRHGSAPTRAERERVLETRRTFHRTWGINKGSTSHIFDGISPLPTDGKVWQLCDMTDPQLAALRDIHELHIRATCDARYFGWYENGTNAKIRVALKAKVDALIEGKSLDNTLLEGFLKLPEKVQFAVDTDQSAPFGTSFNPAEKSNTILAEDKTENTAQANQDAGPLSAHPVAKIGAGTGPRQWFGENPTKQELEWASLYRAFARTEVGKPPMAGGSGKGRLTKSKPRLRQTYRPRNAQGSAQDFRGQAAAEAPSDQGAQIPAGRSQSGVSLDPIDADADDVDIEEIEDGPELAEGEEVLPSIEGMGFGDELDDEELDLDIDIKMEDEEEDYDYGEVAEHQDHIEIISSRDGTEGANSHVGIRDDAVQGADGEE